MGDGVEFSVWIENSNTHYSLFSNYIDPKNFLMDRRWYTYQIDLSSWAGKPVTITFATNPGPKGDKRYDWAGWGEVRIIQPILYDFLDELPIADRGSADKYQIWQGKLTINQELRGILFQLPPSRVIYHITLPEQPELRFGLGIDPDVWSPEKGDGVEYNIYIRKPEEPNKLFWVFQRYIDPKNNAADRRWFDEQVDLNQFAGKTVDIIFEAKSGPSENVNFDWGGWSTPILVGKRVGLTN